jgi:hypothetical protein
MIYTRVGKYGMIDAFRKYGRLKTSETHGNFTAEAIEELFEYYDGLDGNKDRPHYELDVIGICCEWTQYDDIDEVKETYLDVLLHLDTNQETYDSDDVFEYLEDNTYHIVLDDDSILVRDF